MDVREYAIARERPLIEKKIQMTDGETLVLHIKKLTVKDMVGIWGKKKLNPEGQADITMDESILDQIKLVSLCMPHIAPKEVETLAERIPYQDWIRIVEACQAENGFTQEAMQEEKNSPTQMS